MNNYRAILIGVPDLERPVQIFGSHLSNMATWAKEISLKYPRVKYPEARVKVYGIEEILVVEWVDGEGKE